MTTQVTDAILAMCRICERPSVDVDSLGRVSGYLGWTLETMSCGLTGR